jgi:hypothetical protein
MHTREKKEQPLRVAAVYGVILVGLIAHATVVVALTKAGSPDVDRTLAFHIPTTWAHEYLGCGTG